jgi:lipopolysaccharide transport system permease protein
MSSAVQLPASSTRPSFVIEGQKNPLSSEFREIWAYRELLYFLTWQAVKIRYKQTVVGVSWIALQPLLNVAILSIVFGAFVQVPVGDIAYPAFYLTTLVLWNYFASALGRGATSLVSNANLITKVYFPRMIIPFSAVIVPLVDFVVTFLLLLAVLALYGIVPTWRIIFVPVFLGVAMLVALTISLWFSALNVRYRDVNHLMPLIIQIWMYLTPVIYPIGLVPAKWRTLYSLNPMVSVIEGGRWAFLGTDAPPREAFMVSIVFIFALLMGGILYFNRTERTFADVI